MRLLSEVAEKHSLNNCWVALKGTLQDTVKECFFLNYRIIFTLVNGTIKGHSIP